LTSSPPLTLSKTAALLGGLWALWLLLFLCFPINQNDTWWHLKEGAWLWEHRAFPAQDPFSLPSAGAGWLSRSWLFGVLAWPIYALGGPAGLIGAKLLVALATGMLLLGFSLRQGASPALAFAFSALAFAATRFSWTERPQIAAHLLFAASLFALDAAPSLRRNLVLFFVGLLWSNLNGSAIIFPAFVLACEAGRGRDFSWGALAAASAGTLCNPQGAKEYFEVASLFGGQASMRTWITEWNPPILKDAYALTALLVAGLAAAGLAWRQGRRSASLLLLACALPGLRFGRMTPFFCLAVAAWAPVIFPERFQAKRAATALLAAGLVASTVWMLGWERRYAQGLVKAGQFPVRAAEFLAADRPKGNMGNLYKDGAYLLFRLGPDTKVLVDSRQMNYPLRMFETAIALEAGSPAWKFITAKHQLSCWVLPWDSRLAALLMREKGWRVVYADGEYLIFATPREVAAHQGRWKIIPK
jgi:hypothetical protein